jgi:hypothetical protein
VRQSTFPAGEGLSLTASSFYKYNNSINRSVIWGVEDVAPYRGLIKQTAKSKFEALRDQSNEAARQNPSGFVCLD